MGILFRCRRFFQRDTLKLLYYSFLFPYFSYCLEIWGFTFKTYLEPLCILQKKIVRIITSSAYYEHTAKLFADLEILNVSKLASFKLCLFLYKYENKLLPESFNTMFVRNHTIHRYQTRQLNCFHLPVIRNDYIKRSIKYNAIVTYNKFMILFDYTLKYSRFKKWLKSFLLVLEK